MSREKQYDFKNGGVWAQTEREVNQHGYVWEKGVHMGLDDSGIIFDSRAEVEELIAALQSAANDMWPVEAV